MTYVRLTCRRNGRMLSCEAHGHSGYAPEGSDIVCAAVSVLLRTTAQVLSDSFGAAVALDCSARGRLTLSVDADVGNDACRLVYAADFLRSGLRSLQAEYPGHISLQENTKD